MWKEDEGRTPSKKQNSLARATRVFDAMSAERGRD
jgi:hypothetical protein